MNVYSDNLAIFGFSAETGGVGSAMGKKKMPAKMPGQPSIYEAIHKEAMLRKVVDEPLVAPEPKKHRNEIEIQAGNAVIKVAGVQGEFKYTFEGHTVTLNSAPASAPSLRQPTLPAL